MKAVTNKTQQGFTLVELIIVIVILGILAITAAPKFLNLAGDARGGTLQAVLGSVTTANSLVNAKAKIQGKSEDTAEVASNFVYEDGNKIFLAYGFPVTSAVTDVAAVVGPPASPAYDGIDSTELLTMWAGLLDVSDTDFTVTTAKIDTATDLLVATATPVTGTVVEAVVIHPADFTLDTAVASTVVTSCYVYIAQAAASGAKPTAEAVVSGCSN